MSQSLPEEGSSEMLAMSDSPGEQGSELQVPGNPHFFPFCAADSSYCVPELFFFK